MAISTKIIYRFSEVEKEVEHLKLTGITRGRYLGFKSLHDFYSFKEAGTTYIYSAPFSGKSEFSFELMMNLTEFYGNRHVIYSPESGTAAEIFAELLSKRCRKPFYKNFNDHITESEYQREKDFINEYFYILDPKDTELTIEDFYDGVKKIEKEYEKKINVTWCDPFNELKHEFGETGRQDLYIENRLGYIRRDAMTNNRHNVMITHSTEKDPVKTKEGRSYYPAPTAREIAGGHAWYRKAMNLICIWRPPGGVIDPLTGTPYEENEAHIKIMKYKPKGVGKQGTVKLYFDQQTNRYYEKIDGSNYFARKEGAIIPKELNIKYEY